jgi:hypothetical protein
MPGSNYPGGHFMNAIRQARAPWAAVRCSASCLRSAAGICGRKGRIFVRPGHLPGRSVRPGAFLECHRLFPPSGTRAGGPAPRVAARLVALRGRLFRSRAVASRPRGGFAAALSGPPSLALRSCSGRSRGRVFSSGLSPFVLYRPRKGTPPASRVGGAPGRCPPPRSIRAPATRPTRDARARVTE